MRIKTDRRQVDSYDCGPTVAAATLDALGFDAAEVDRLVASIPCTPANGTCPSTLEAFFRSCGCSGQVGEMTVSDLAHHTRRGRLVCCLVQRNGFGHWVVVYRVAYGEVYWHCPVDGLSSSNAVKFRRHWWDWDRRGTAYPGFGLAVWR